MHIALVTTSYPDSGSGSEAAGGFVADFARELANHARVSVVAATAAGPSVRGEGEVQVHRFSVRRWPLSLLKPYNPADWWSIYSTLRDGSRTLQGLVEADRPDYILALWALPSGYWARNAQQRYGIPYGIWALGSDIWGLGRVPILRSYLRMVLREAEQRFADGLELARDVERLSGRSCGFMASARKLPVQTERKVADAPPYRLAYLGRWHPNKGVDVFLDALGRLSDADWSQVAEVRVNGGGPLEADVRHRVAELKHQGRPVSMGGYLDTAGAVELISWTDYLVLPSRVESVPVIFSDAAQLRRPLVATPVGDLPRLFDRYEVGILAGGPSADEFADALRQALQDRPSRFENRLEAAAGEFDIAAIAARFCNHLKEREL